MVGFRVRVMLLHMIPVLCSLACTGFSCICFFTYVQTCYIVCCLLGHMCLIQIKDY